MEAANSGTRRQQYRNTNGELCTRHIGRYSYHSFRHTFCTMAANAGKDLSVIRSIVGHAGIKMTEHYTHYSLESKRQVIESLPLPQRSIAKPIPLQELIPSLTSSQLADLGSWLEHKLTSELKKELLLKMDYCPEKAN